MTLRVQLRCIDGDYLYCPCFICDRCGAPIDRYEEGIAEYGLKEHDIGNLSEVVMHYHVGECAGRLPAGMFCSPLRAHLSNLCHNTGVSNLPQMPITS